MHSQTEKPFLMHLEGNRRWVPLACLMFGKEEEFKGTVSRQVDFVNNTTVGPLWIAVFI